MNKPQVLNQSDYWNSEFTNSFSYLSTFIVTNGIVGSLLWIIFLILFFALGIRALKRVKEGSARFAVLSTFFGSAFLWIILLIYNPSQIIIFLTFIMTGLFVAVLGSESIIKDYKYTYEEGTL